MYDIVVTTKSSAEDVRVYETSQGDIMVAVDGPNAGQVLLHIGQDRVINLTKLRGASERAGDYSYRVKVLTSTEAISMIVR